ncbi:MAG: 30S ribosomal protein S2 [Deltaproteobacteria bacterium]|nr:30S ribosomal protein S2 [Deltaproteobacteria bacterium]
MDTAAFEPREKVEVNVRTLLEAGVHFGHQTARWNPAMAPFIYGVRNGIHIISLPRTVQCWNRARQAVVDIVAQGGNVLFVGTKKQAQEAVQMEASRCGAYFVSKRWLGGMLTNFSTIRRSIDRMKKLEETLAIEEESIKTGGQTKFTKKERLNYSREIEKLNFSLGGIREMTALPQLLFVIDVKREDIAVKEARRLDIPVVALVDTNCDPKSITYAIPSNDDGSRAVRLFARAIGEAIADGKKKYEENVRAGKIANATPRGRDDNKRSASNSGAVSAAPVVAPVVAPVAVAPEAPAQSAAETAPASDAAATATADK